MPENFHDDSDVRLVQRIVFVEHPEGFTLPVFDVFQDLNEVEISFS